MTLIGYKGFGPQTFEEDFRMPVGKEGSYQVPSNEEHQRILYSPGLEGDLLRQIAQLPPLPGERRSPRHRTPGSSQMQIRID